MQMGCESSQEAIRIYAMWADLLAARRYMKKLEEIGAPHPERLTIDMAINLMAPSYREKLEYDFEHTDLFATRNVGPEGVAHAVRLARALRECLGIAMEPRRSTTI